MLFLQHNRTVAKRPGYALMRPHLGAGRLLRGAMLCLVGLCLVLASRTATAQEDGQTQWPDILPDGVLNTQARLWFYDGEKPILIPSGSLEEILSLRNEFGGDDVGVLPNWNYSEFQVDVDASQPIGGSATGVANVQVRTAIETGPRETLATVPLRLESLRLKQPPNQEVSGRSILRPSAGGYEWLLAVKPDSIARLTLDGRIVVQNDGERFALRLTLPMAVCNLQVQLPNDATDIRVSNDDVMDAQRRDGETNVSITSSGGTVEVTWRVGAVRDVVAAVEANSISTFSVREPTGIWTVQSNCDLLWSGRNSSPKVNIVLPPGARFRSPPSYNFDEQIQVSRIPASENEPEQLIVENFAPEQTQNVDIQFDWELSPELSQNSELSTRLEMPRLQIAGVDSHRGRFEILYPSQYATAIQRITGATLLQQSRTEDAGRRLSFGFDDDRFQLQLVFRREQSLPIVRPTYNLHADASKLTLTAWLDCSFDPNQLTHELGFKLKDWTLEENSALEISGFGEANQQQQAILVRPSPDNEGAYALQGPEPDAANFSSGLRERKLWKIVAYRPWSAGDSLQLELPEIILGKLGGKDIRGAGSGVLIVSSAENILLSDLAGQGLLTDTYSSMYLPYLPPGAEQWREPSVFRFQARRVRPTLTASTKQLAQQIVSTDTVEIVLLPSQVEIRQQYNLNIANDPLEELLFAVHETPDSFQPPQVYIDGSLIAAEPVRRVDSQGVASAFAELIAERSRTAEVSTIGGDMQSDGQAAEQDDQTAEPNGAAGNASASGEQPVNQPRYESLPNGQWTIYRLVAPPKMIGESKIEISTGAFWSPDTELGDDQIRVQLAVVHLPAATRTLRRQASLQDVADVRASWVPVVTSGADGSSTAPGAVTALADSVSELLVMTQAKLPAEASGGRIENAWLQTAITNLHRRDRFCFQYIGSQSTLEISLPRFVDDLQVVVDGQTSEDFVYDNAENLLLVNIPAAKSTDSEPAHVVEVSYFQQENVAWFRSLDMKCPTVESIGRVGRFYWQLVTPGTQHLGSAPLSLTPEWRWVWDGLCWRRQSLDVDFEQLLGASKQASLAQSMNRYSMSGSEIRPARVWLLSRFALWFPVGLLAILTSFAILNYRTFRHPVAMLVYAILLAAFALATPGFAMLIAQTSLVALVLVFLLWATQVAVESRVRRRSVFSGHSLSTLESMPGFGSNISNTLTSPSPTNVLTGGDSKVRQNGNSTTIGASEAAAEGGG